MEIRTANFNDIAALADYQCAMFPERSRGFAMRYMQLWTSKSLDAISDSYLIEDDKKQICGQELFSSMTYWCAGEKKVGVWEFDLIVDDELRKDNWGLDLLLTTIARHNHIFATGSNDTALRIHLKLGKNLLGHIRKYVKPVNPLYIATALWRGNITAVKFPKNVMTGAARWVKVEATDFPVLDKPFNAGLFEVGRDIDFLRWRFTQLHEYVFYRIENGDDYFVVRTIVKKHITALVIVDFRCDLCHGGRFEQIVNAATQIAKNLRLPMLITGSSLAVTDEVLEHNGFRSVGRPRPIIGNDKRLKGHKDEVESRDFCLVTLADSDGEVCW